MLVSSAEPEALRMMGPTSAVCEEHGVDFLWAAPGGVLVGVQRKEFKDLCASLTDGRLARELAMMNRLAIAMLIVEGDGQWTLDGQSMMKYGGIPKAQYRSVLYSVQARGCWVETTANMTETMAVLRGFEAWTQKDRHEGLTRRPKPKGRWGTPSLRDYQLFVLQSLPAMGPTTAAKVLDHFGRVPMAFDTDLSELSKVAGVGVPKARKWMEALGEVRCEHPARMKNGKCRTCGDEQVEAVATSPVASPGNSEAAPRRGGAVRGAVGSRRKAAGKQP